LLDSSVSLALKISPAIVSYLHEWNIATGFELGTSHPEIGGEERRG
jgi:hypothetical protein